MLNNKNTKKKIKPELIFLIISGMLVLSLLLLIILTAITYSFKLNKTNILLTLKSDTFWKLEGVLLLILFSYLFIKFVLDKLGKSAKELTDGEDSDFLNKSDIKTKKSFVLTSFKKLNEVEDGTIFEASLKKDIFGREKDIDIIMTKEPCHTLTVGTTGSGKTSGYIDPIIQILMNTKTKPSMIISDVKGELYRKHSKSLEEKGYIVKVLDLREPYKSFKWNPFNLIIKKLNKIKELSKNNNFENKIEIQSLKDEITNDAREIIYSICPIEENTSDKSWSEGARDFILSIVYGFIEDIEEGVMKSDKLTLFNLQYNISRYIQIGQEKVLIEYLTFRDKHSLVAPKANTVLSSMQSEKTFAGFKSNISRYISKFSDKGILSMTSKNDIDISEFDEKSQVLFIQVPDEKVSRHYLVTMLIEQCYKELVDKASLNLEMNETEDMILKKRVYFLLDEFANFPKLKDFETIISVSRSRGIFFNLIIQNYEQLNYKYEKIADTIKNNCPMKVFLGSDSVKTMKEFQDLGGYKKGNSISTSKNGNSNQTSTSIKEIPLVTISDLKTLNSKDNMGNALISCFGLPLYISKFTPWFLVKNIYKISSNLKIQKRKSEIFDEEKILYDIEHKIKNRNFEKEEAEELLNLIKEEDKEKEDKKTQKEDKFQKLIKQKIESLKNLIPDEDFETLKNSENKKDIILSLIAEEKNNRILIELQSLRNLLEKSEYFKNTKRRGDYDENYL